MYVWVYEKKTNKGCQLKGKGKGGLSQQKESLAQK